MNKVLYLPLNYGHVVQNGVYDAFREAGCQLEIFDYYMQYSRKSSVRRIRENLISKATSFKPDLIYMQIQHTTIIDAPTIATIKHRIPNVIVANWTGDVRNYVPRTYKKIAQVSDYNFISSTGQLELFKREIPNKNIQYLQIGFNPRLYYPLKETKNNFEYDVVFTANVNTREKYPGHKERMLTAQKLRDAFGNRFGLFGHGWPPNVKGKGEVTQNALKDIYHNSFSLISVSHFNNISHYFSDRLLMCMACGRPTVSWAFPRWESYFTNNCDLVIANGPDDIVAKVKHLLNNPDMANYIGDSGAIKVAAEHTYLSRINELLHMVGLKKA